MTGSSNVTCIVCSGSVNYINVKRLEWVDGPLCLNCFELNKQSAAMKFPTWLIALMSKGLFEKEVELENLRNVDENLLLVAKSNCGQIRDALRWLESRTDFSKAPYNFTYGTDQMYCNTPYAIELTLQAGRSVKDNNGYKYKKIGHQIHRFYHDTDTIVKIEDDFDIKYKYWIED